MVESMSSLALPCGKASCTTLFAAMRKVASTQTFHRGEVVVQQGDAPTFVGLVLSGRVKVVSHTHAGRDVGLKMLEPGQVFGLIPVLDREPYPASVVAVDDAEIGKVEASRFEGILRSDPDLGLRILRSLSARMRRLTQTVCTNVVADVEARLAQRLVELAAGGPVVAVTRQELADLAGTTVETAIRISKGWERDQLVRLARGQVEVLDPKRLARLSGRC